MPSRKINALRTLGATLAAAAVALVIYSTSSSSEFSQTLEEAAKATCFKQRSSVRDLVERVRAMPPGGTVEMLETMEFSFCVGREEAVLKEEVRRGLRPAFKGQAEQEAREAAERERASRPETDAEYFARTGFHYCDVRRGCNPAPMPLGQR
jgi:long-subunit acyl-CoA synthetase (AMP-forming)